MKASTSVRLSGGDLLAACAVIVIWGLNFVVMKIGLRQFTPFQLGTVRYLFAALPLVLLVRRPGLPMRWMVCYGLAQGVGQFGLLFVALQVGMTAALASVMLQTQVFFTTLLGMLFLEERVDGALRVGLVLAAIGLACFALNVAAGPVAGGATTALGLLLTLGSAAMWGTANIITRRAQRVRPDYDAVSFVVWSSVFPIVPFAAMSLLLDPVALRWQWLQADAAGWAAGAYLGWIATVLGYAMWTGLFKRHPANQVAPFSLGVPLVGLAAGMLLLDERITPWQWAGIAFIGLALGVVIFGKRWQARRTPGPGLQGRSGSQPSDA